MCVRLLAKVLNPSKLPQYLCERETLPNQDHELSLGYLAKVHQVPLPVSSAHF